MVPNKFSHEVDNNLRAALPAFYYFPNNLLDNFPELNAFISLYQKCGQLELQVVRDIMLKKICKNH